MHQLILVYKKKKYPIQNYQDLINFAEIRKKNHSINRPAFLSENELIIEQQVELATFFKSAKMFTDLANIAPDLAHGLLHASKEELEGIAKAGMSGSIFELNCASSSGKMIGSLFFNQDEFDALPDNYVLRKTLALYVKPEIVQHPAEQKLYLGQQIPKPDVYSNPKYKIRNTALMARVGMWKEETGVPLDIHQEPDCISILHYKHSKEYEKIREALNDSSCALQ